ncbi:MAG: GIY-YIG nuclease family protein [bacterium]
MACFVYYLFSKKIQKYYLGKTCNLGRRLLEHNNSEEIFTKRGVPWRLVSIIECHDYTQASKLEKKLKQAKNKKYVHWFFKNHGKSTE